MFFKQFQCPDCGGSEAYRSRRRNSLEKYILPLLMLQPVRCANCYRRSKVSTLVDVLVPEDRLAAKRKAAA